MQDRREFLAAGAIALAAPTLGLTVEPAVPSCPIHVMAYGSRQEPPEDVAAFAHDLVRFLPKSVWDHSAPAVRSQVVVVYDASRVVVHHDVRRFSPQMIVSRNVVVDLAAIKNPEAAAKRAARLLLSKPLFVTSLFSDVEESPVPEIT